MKDRLAARKWGRERGRERKGKIGREREEMEGEREGDREERKGERGREEREGRERGATSPEFPFIQSVSLQQ